MAGAVCVIVMNDFGLLRRLREITRARAGEGPGAVYKQEQGAGKGKICDSDV